MSVTSGDIKIYGSQYMQEDDLGIQGGDIALDTLVLFDNAILANYPSGAISVVSNLSTDSGSISIIGRNTGGSIISGAIDMTGSEPATGLLSYERLLKIIALAHSGTVTVKDSGNNIITTIPSGISYVRRPFYNVAADIEGGSSKTYYEKIFIRNNNTLNDLLNAGIAELQTGLYNQISFALENYCNFNASYSANTSTNRLTAPTVDLHPSGFDSNVKLLIEDTNLQATGAIGVWLALTISPGASAEKNVYGLAVSGSTI